MPRRPSRFSGFNARSAGLWVLAAVLASVAVWLAPAHRAAAPTGDLVFFEFADDAGPPLDAGVVDSSPTDAAPWYPPQR
ncbi:MAG: hypothetical protein GXP55_14080 [Deltaproteobacteria bacterium]|nr:hypothetical protein [Deltaproteobacteria bacterium]